MSASAIDVSKVDSTVMAARIKSMLRTALNQNKRTTVQRGENCDFDDFEAAATLNEQLSLSIREKDYLSSKKLSAKLASLLANRERTVSVAGHAVKNSIFLISSLVLKELKHVAVSEPQKFSAFVAANAYPFDTTTRFLSLMLNDVKFSDIPAAAPASGKGYDGVDMYGEASFRGKYGIYAALAKLGFILKKDNIKLDGSKSTDGSKVRLWVNLEWMLPFCQLDRGNSTQNSLQTNISYTNTVKAANSTNNCGNVENSANAVCAVQMSSRLTAETQMDKGGKKGDLEKKEIFARDLLVQAIDVVPQQSAPQQSVPQQSVPQQSAPFSAPAPPVIEVGNVVRNAIAFAEENIFTTEMYQSGRIRTNKNTIIKSHNPAYEQDERLKMLELYRTVRTKLNKNWAEVDSLIKKAIKQTQSFLKKNPSRYIYTKTMFFDIEMENGLFDTIMKVIDFEARRKAMRIRELNEKLEANSLDIDWIGRFIEDGADKLRTMRIVKSKGKSFVVDCIRYAYAHCKRGFIPTNGIVAFIFGIIRNATEKIKMLANQEEILLASGFPFKKEVKAKEYSTETNKHIFSIIKKAESELKVRLTNEQINSLIDKSIKQKANEAQIYVWVEGIKNKKP